MPMEIIQDPAMLAQIEAQRGQDQGDQFTAAFPGINSNLQGPDYLKQFPQEIQAGVHDYVSGRTMPTGNPRRDNVIKRIAGKYGQDIGVPADDTNFAARRALQTGLASGTPSSTGGQLRNGTTAMDHLAKLGDAITKLDNYDLGLTTLTEGVNKLRGFTTAQSAKADAVQTAAHHYGQEITKFYAGSPGAATERQRFMNSLSTIKSPQELASVLEMEMSLIPGKMDQLREEIKQLGPYAEKKYIQKFEEQDLYKQRLSAAINKLRGVAPEGQAAPKATTAVPTAAPEQSPGGPAPQLGFPDGATATNPKTGQKIQMRNGAWQPQ